MTSSKLTTHQWGILIPPTFFASTSAPTQTPLGPLRHVKLTLVSAPRAQARTPRILVSSSPANSETIPRLGSISTQPSSPIRAQVTLPILSRFTGGALSPSIRIKISAAIVPWPRKYDSYCVGNLRDLKTERVPSASESVSSCVSKEQVISWLEWCAMVALSFLKVPFASARLPPSICESYLNGERESFSLWPRRESKNWM